MRIHGDVPSMLKIELRAALRGSDDHEATFGSLLTSFLQGSGIPSTSLFASVRDHFNPIVDLSAIGDEGFRARMFCWATTGSCERARDASPISVCHELCHSFYFSLNHLFSRCGLSTITIQLMAITISAK